MKKYKKCKSILCILLSLALLCSINTLNVLSNEPNVKKYINEIPINFTQDENILTGQFNLEVVNEKNIKDVYFVLENQEPQVIDINLNNENQNIEFIESKQNLVEEKYIIGNITESIVNNDIEENIFTINNLILESKPYIKEINVVAITEEIENEDIVLPEEEPNTEEEEAPNIDEEIPEEEGIPNIDEEMLKEGIDFDRIVANTEITENFESSEIMPIDVNWKRTPEKYEGKIIDANWSGKISSKERILTENTTSNKGILRTPKLISDYNSNSKYFLDYENIKTYIEPTIQMHSDWKDIGGVMAYNWPFYDTGSKYEEWRMLRGEFNLTQTQINELMQGRGKLVIGINSTNSGTQMMLPFNDTMSVLIDEKVTDINFTTAPNSSLNLQIDGSKKKLPLKQGYHGCSIREHNIGASNEIDKWHAHLNEFSGVDVGGGKTLIGDISNIVTQNPGTHKIEIITGEYAVGGGVAKLEVYYIPPNYIPDIEVKKRAYLKEDNKNNYIEDGDFVAPGQKVYFEFEMKNIGEAKVTGVSFKDMELNINKLIDQNGIHAISPTTGEIISSDYNTNIEIYKVKNNISTKVGIKDLAELEVNESVIVRHESLSYTPTQKDTIVINHVTGKAKYLNNQLEQEGSASINIKVEKGSIRIQKLVVNENNQQISDDQIFNITISGSDGSIYNIAAYPNQIYHLDNLKYGVTYTISETVPMNYKFINISKNNINLGSTTDNILVSITNKKANNRGFYDKDRTENSFKYKPN